MRSACSLLLVLSVLAPAQQQPSSDKPFTLTSASNLVIINVEAKDKSGKPMENLKREDFQVMEDGKPQQIAVFEFQKLGESGAAPLATKLDAVKPDAARVRPAGISSAATGQIRYQDKRLMVLLFDFSSMPIPDQLRAQQAALKFLDQQMSASDLVAIMTNASRLRVEQDFTDNRETLIGVIKGFMIGQASELAQEGEVGDAENGEDNGAAFIADEAEFNIFNTDKKLTALETAAKMLAPLPEKKAIIYFSSGVGKTGTENQSQLQATVNAAVRANVSFYPIDARGLIAMAPAGDAGQASQRGTGVFSGKAQSGLKEKLNDQQETLHTLAADTGGKAFLDSNDLALGIKQAQLDVVSYYIVGYYSANPSQDGHFRRVKVSVGPSLNAKLEYRSGYFAAKRFEKFTNSDKERQLQEALLLGDPITDLRVALEVNYFRLTKDSYFVPVSVKIPASQISLKKAGADETTELDFIAQIRDKSGKLVGNLRDGIKVKLKEAEASQTKKRSFQYTTGFTMIPGEYKLKFLTRENQTGKMGTFETKFTVPDLTQSTDALRLSSVVWSSQREPLASAVGTAGTSKKLLSADPLVQDGQRLAPSITHAFRRDQNLLVYVEVYDPGTDPQSKTASVSANLSFYLGGKKAFESPAVLLDQTAKLRKSPTLPIQFQVPLAKLAPGQYTCQINIVDEVGRKFAFPRGSVVLLP
ncbi:MAG TPA: VWA domain-containing protein [Bryobacteraceae bacterium]|nr:VWA domain-containing protein [Bryobacteraceae bacterium]